MYLVAAVLIGGSGIGVWQLVGNNKSTFTARSIIVPELSEQALRGKIAFDRNCARCHGVNAAGTRQGPSFVNEIYNPGHHGDAAFFRAAANGVRQHHWPYGDMPPQPQVTQEEVALIIEYVRALQKANGIVWKRHTM